MLLSLYSIVINWFYHTLGLYTIMNNPIQNEATIGRTTTNNKTEHK